MIQQRLCKTIAASLATQLARNGSHWSEVVELANELLEEAARLQSREERSEGEESPAPELLAEQKFIPALSETQRLSNQGCVDLDERMYVRWLTDDDKVVVARWQSDEAISKDLSIYTLQRILGENRIADSVGEGDILLAICRKNDQQPIGVVGLINIDRTVRQGELVKMIGDTAERGKGYARTATRILVTYGFENLQMDRIYLRTLDANQINIALNQSLGFVFEGHLRQAVSVRGQTKDVVLMALLRSDSQGRYQASTLVEVSCPDCSQGVLLIP